MSSLRPFKDVCIIHPCRAMAEAALTTALLLHAQRQRTAAALREERNWLSSDWGLRKTITPLSSGCGV